MLVVLDTNILLSALRAERSLPGGIDSPDPDDAYLLAMAIAARADFLVTGDKALLAMRRIGTTRVISARRFAAMLAR